MPNPLSKLISPRYPPMAVGLERGVAAVVNLERVRGGDCAVRRAATYNLSDSVINPSFDGQNIENPTELVSILRDLASSAGLLRQKRWSVTLPEATTRTLVLTLEGPVSGTELQEVLAWKMERGFGASLDQLSVTREPLQKDDQGRTRYMAIGIYNSVLAEYESVFASLGWRVGLILPRHVGESQWLLRNGGGGGDSLLLSASDEGFTAIIFRDKSPLILRNVNCPLQECEDELYRLLMFYSDRRSATEAGNTTRLSRLLVVGDGLSGRRASEIVNETTGGDLRALGAADLGLSLPSQDLSFDAIAAPAGLAALSF